MTKIESAVDRLLDLGYLKFVPETERRAKRKEFLHDLNRGGAGFELGDRASSPDGRCYRLNVDELMMGRMGQALLAVGPVLRAEGVPLESAADHIDGENHTVEVQGKRYLVYDAAQSATGWSLKLAKKRFLELANEFLEKAGSPERFYALGGSEQGFRVIALTNEMYNLLRRPDLKLKSDFLPRTLLELE